MKVLTISIILAYFHILTQHVSGKLQDINDCLTECLNISKSNICFCDKQCLNYKDCCKLYSLKCKDFFDFITNSTNSSFKGNSCCSDVSNSDCFCDSKCVGYKDCCEDYLKCGTKFSNGNSMKRITTISINDHNNKSENVQRNIEYSALIKLNMNYTSDSK